MKSKKSKRDSGISTTVQITTRHKEPQWSGEVGMKGVAFVREYPKVSRLAAWS